MTYDELYQEQTEVLGERIRNARVRYCLTRQQLAKKMKTTAGMVGSWENGTSRPDSETIRNLARYIGVHVPDLLKPCNSMGDIVCRKRYRSNASNPGFAKKIGEDIICYRSKYGLTQEQLAGMMHVHPNYIQEWESGRKQPPNVLQRQVLEQLQSKPKFPEKESGKDDSRGRPQEGQEGPGDDAKGSRGSRDGDDKDVQHAPQDREGSWGDGGGGDQDRHHPPCSKTPTPPREIEKHREWKGVSLSKMAKKLGVKDSDVRRWESGRKRIPTEFASRYYAVLDETKEEHDRVTEGGFDNAMPRISVAGRFALQLQARGRKIQERRIASGLTEAELAAAMKVSVEKLQAIERGESRPRYEQDERMYKLLGCSSSDIWVPLPDCFGNFDEEAPPNG